MDNSSDMDAGMDFTDLLSAAMSESGLMDLGDTDIHATTTVRMPASTSLPFLAARPTISSMPVIQQQNIIFRPTSVPVAPRNVVSFSGPVTTQISTTGGLIRMLRVPNIPDAGSPRRFIIRSLPAGLQQNRSGQIMVTAASFQQPLAGTFPQSTVVIPGSTQNVRFMRSAGTTDIPSSLPQGAMIRLVSLPTSRPLAAATASPQVVRIAAIPRPTVVSAPIVRPQFLVTSGARVPTPGASLSIQVRPRLTATTVAPVHLRPSVITSTGTMAPRPVVLRPTQNRPIVVGARTAITPRPLPISVARTAVVVTSSGAVIPATFLCRQTAASNTIQNILTAHTASPQVMTLALSSSAAPSPIQTSSASIPSVVTSQSSVPESLASSLLPGLLQRTSPMISLSATAQPAVITAPSVKDPIVSVATATSVASAMADTDALLSDLPDCYDVCRWSPTMLCEGMDIASAGESIDANVATFPAVSSAADVDSTLTAVVSTKQQETSVLCDSRNSAESSAAAVTNAVTVTVAATAAVLTAIGTTTTVSTATTANTRLTEISSMPSIQNTNTARSDNIGSMMSLGGDNDDDDDDNPFLQALMELTDTNKKLEEELKQKEADEPSPSVTATSAAESGAAAASAPIRVISDTRPTASETLQPSLSQLVSTTIISSAVHRSSPLTIVTLPPGATVPSAYSNIVRVLPRIDSASRLSATGSPPILDQRPTVWAQPSPSLASLGRLSTEIGTNSSFQAAFNQTLRSLGTSTSAFVVHNSRSGHLPMSASTPNLLAAAANKQHVLVDEMTGRIITTVMPPIGNNRLNDDLKLRRISTSATGFTMGVGNQLEEEELEEEELGHAETYADYMPAKLRFGSKHPDPVVETSSLSSVEVPNVAYRLLIPEEVIDCGYLSALQLETIVYACQKHETFLPCGERAGFLVGDGAGVGKGRTIAGIIYENYLHDRKRSLWLSVSNDLRIDAERDLRDIAASKIEVHPLNKFKYAKISSKVNGSVKKGVIFSTYSSLIGESQAGGKYRTRLKQLVHWLGKEFDGLIIFDECHRAKNLCPVGSSKPTKTGKTVVELQQRLPKARVVYASATGASEPRNMAYMTRLGLWGPGTPFPVFQDFIDAIEKRGVGAMELVAMDMKQRGMYIARQLSFHGVAFRIEEVAIDKESELVYNASVRLWAEAREKFEAAANLIDAEHRMRKTMWGQFWSAHQRFFKYLCISAKVKHCVQLALDAVRAGKCVVIGLQSTGEARTLEQLEECGGELNDFVSTALGVFQSLVEKHFPAPDRRKTFDLFGSSGSTSRLFDDSPVPSPLATNKRKRDSAGKSDTKRAKVSWNDDDSSSETDDTKKKAKSESSSSEEEEEESEDDDDDESDDNSSDDEDHNPFAKGSDSDDDPWLKRSRKHKEKPVKEKKKKEKKVKKERKPKKKCRRKNDSGDDDDEFDNFDKECDRVFEEAKKKSLTASLMASSKSVPGMNAVDKANSMKKELLDKISMLGDRLPPNTLDELIDDLGGPDNVAEMTGRKGRVVSTKDGVQYESRSEVDVRLEIMNLTEKQRFMDGEKLIAIISEAASSGISLHADRRAINQRRRVHITLELPWSADRAIQQFGRTHRSNQVSAPEYIFLISQLAGEQRFASTVAKRLESLGALTHGDRRATETRDLSRFNIDNRYGRMALEVVMKCILHCDLQAALRLTAAIPDYAGNFLQDIRTAMIGVGLIIYENGNYSFDKDYSNISKFLNRILGIEVELQNKLFRYFTDTLTSVILQEKRKGAWDMGILDLGSSGESVTVIETKTYSGSFSGTATKISLNTVSVERGMNWLTAVDVAMEHDAPDDGFYLSKQDYSNKRKLVLLAVSAKAKKRDPSATTGVSCVVYRPNTGRQPRLESFAEVRKKYRKVADFDTARYHWEDLYDTSAGSCLHVYMHGGCHRGALCENGLRSRRYFILSGSVLSVWTNVERVLASRMQIIRLRTDDGKKIVGTLVPASSLDALNLLLSHDSNKNKSQVVVSAANSSGGGNMSHLQSLPTFGRPLPPGFTIPGHYTAGLMPGNAPLSGRTRPLTVDSPPAGCLASLGPTLNHDGKPDIEKSVQPPAHLSMPTFV